MKSGLQKPRESHKDYDLHLTYGVVENPTFPAEYSVENGLWCPNQNTSNLEFSLPPLPFGCTDFTQADLCADDDGKLYNPLILEAITLANEKGGADIRQALEAAKLAFIRTYYMRITPHAPMDAFDSLRYAMISGLPEKRSVSMGSPWYPQFSFASNGVLPIPDNFNGEYLWHNHKICGWKVINGQPHLISKPWQGPQYGDKGFVYFSRPLINTLFSIRGTCAYTLTNTGTNVIQTVDLPFIQKIISYLFQAYESLRHA